jgi:hypothetical protein
MSSTHQPASGYPSGARPASTDERTAPYAGREPADYQTYEADRASGSTFLAAWLLILGGLWSFFLGLGVVVNTAYFKSLPGYTSVAHDYAYGWNLSGWGWANLVLGIVVVAAGVCVLLGQTWARWAGIVLAVISAIGTFLFLPIYPFWSIVVIAIDVFIIWALATARRRRDT